MGSNRPFQTEYSLNDLDELLARHEKILNSMQGVSFNKQTEQIVQCQPIAPPAPPVYESVKAAAITTPIMQMPMVQTVPEPELQFEMPVEANEPEQIPVKRKFGFNPTEEKAEQEIGGLEFFPAPILKANDKAKRKKRLGLIGNLLFYGLLVAVMITGIVYISGGDGDRPIWGFDFYNVWCGSMERKYPVGSMVIVKNIPADQIKEGDDITFFESQDKKVTHEVVKVIEDYKDGQRGFETKGLENELPDPEIVHADNVIGKVVWHIPKFGQTLESIKTFVLERWYLLILIALGGTGVFVLLKYIFKKEPKEKESAEGVENKPIAINP